jgi:predicted metal-dependent hydrolase
MPLRERRRGAALRERVRYWSRRLNAELRVVRVQRMTRKWGSCSTAGIISLAEDLELQPIAFQDFVIAHELLHLRIPNHGRLFKALMTMYVPGWRALEVSRGRSRVTRPDKPGSARRQSL